MEDFVTEVHKSHEILFDRLKSLNFKVKPSRGNYLFLDCETIDRKNTIIANLKAHNIFVRDFAHLQGYESHIRITLGTVEQTRHFLKCFENTI